jgi:hypothetical protein
METPKLQITNKGFKILDVTAVQCLAWGGLGICDYCNKATINGKYIGCLNSYYCEDCFNSWHKTATNYPEDSGFEQAHIEDILFRIELA